MAALVNTPLLGLGSHFSKSLWHDRLMEKAIVVKGNIPWFWSYSMDGAVSSSSNPSGSLVWARAIVWGCGQASSPRWLIIEMHHQHLCAVRCKTLWAVILLLGFLAEIKRSVSFALWIFQSSLATDSAVGKTCSCVGSSLCNFNDFIRKCSYFNNYKRVYP